MAPSAGAMPAAEAAADAPVAATAAWRAPGLLLSFIDGDVDRALGFGQALERLRELKHHYDPANLFAAAHAV
jgi:hypothetical protein